MQESVRTIYVTVGQFDNVKEVVHASRGPLSDSDQTSWRMFFARIKSCQCEFWFRNFTASHSSTWQELQWLQSCDAALIVLIFNVNMRSWSGQGIRMETSEIFGSFWVLGPHGFAENKWWTFFHQHVKFKAESLAEGVPSSWCWKPRWTILLAFCVVIEGLVQLGEDYENLPNWGERVWSGEQSSGQGRSGCRSGATWHCKMQGYETFLISWAYSSWTVQQRLYVRRRSFWRVGRAAYEWLGWEACS